jgi:hypothetical protein
METGNRREPKRDRNGLIEREETKSRIRLEKRPLIGSRRFTTKYFIAQIISIGSRNSTSKTIYFKRTVVDRRSIIWKIPSARSENKSDVLAIREEDHHHLIAQS